MDWENQSGEGPAAHLDSQGMRGEGNQPQKGLQAYHRMNPQLVRPHETFSLTEAPGPQHPPLHLYLGPPGPSTAVHPDLSSSGPHALSHPPSPSTQTSTMLPFLGVPCANPSPRNMSQLPCLLQETLPDPQAKSGSYSGLSQSLCPSP